MLFRSLPLAESAWRAAGGWQYQRVLLVQGERFDAGTYGICEMSGKPIPHARLEAIPFARFTVECQTQIEKQKKAMRVRQPVTSLFGLTDEEGGEGEEEDTITDSKD